MKTFSVIIPSLNEEKRIEGLLLDIRSQTVQPEKIIVADKSTDHTPELATKHGAIIVEGVDDYFIGRARNNGAKATKSELLFFLDADNRIRDRKYFEEIISQFEKDKNLDIAHSILVSDSKKLSLRVSYIVYNFIRKLGNVIRITLSDVGGGLVLTQRAFKRLNGYREDLRNNEDIDLLRRARKLGMKYRILKTKLVICTRRLQNLNPLELIWLSLSAILITILVWMGYSSSNKLVKRLEGVYWKRKNL